MRGEPATDGPALPLDPALGAVYCVDEVSQEAARWLGILL